MAAINIRDLGLMEYEPVWQSMSHYTDQRDADSPDEFWLVQHPPVFTQGQAGKAEHLLMPGDIPVVQVDRGGQVTYHGPGQLVLYPLINLRRLGIGVRDLVTAIETALVNTLASFGLDAYPKADAPGVYVNDAKIASLGLRVRKGCSFHGLSLNVDMSLEPFLRINPCGYQGLQMVQMVDLLDESPDYKKVETELVRCLMAQLGYDIKNEVAGLPSVETCE
ncbi:lipoyl(octanoyl) transferase LipB [Pseudoteredinibacter isoporae]|uniref:Octanoyltransferase n=1 Tax=Pseudoteredinibacter isoporae TaxID=570281 RepID=A0A7X0JW75_9GAMM|nr:lipoyl(octanoyl) transferase LipB [Pseudoteredinibacter isoporae]MBB6522944.1 lipoyl(octanoyl) transferase [Pseudoteredinibacter isoporae]NIB22133.1 lipoyl(octanoyl) transferase LipB [Pseudoteredinibacter isoporae]